MMRRYQRTQNLLMTAFHNHNHNHNNRHGNQLISRHRPWTPHHCPRDQSTNIVTPPSTSVSSPAQQQQPQQQHRVKPNPKIAVSVVLFHIPNHDTADINNININTSNNDNTCHNNNDMHSTTTTTTTITSPNHLDHVNVLLIKRGKPPAQDIWSLPGGRMENHETIFECGVRELWEETGIREDRVRFASRPYAVAEFVTNEYHYIILELFGMVQGNDHVPLRFGDDASDIGWCPISLFEHHERYLLPSMGITDATYHEFPFVVDPPAAASSSSSTPTMTSTPATTTSTSSSTNTNITTSSNNIVIPSQFKDQKYNGSIMPVINIAKRMLSCGLFQFQPKQS